MSRLLSNVGFVLQTGAALAISALVIVCEVAYNSCRNKRNPRFFFQDTLSSNDTNQPTTSRSQTFG